MYFRINMTFTNAVKQRRYLERRDKDPSRRKEHLKKQKEKYKNDLQVGKLKRISDMTPREQRKQRKEWRKIKQNQRKRKKKEEVKALTPPSSPEDISQREHHSTTRKKRAIAKCYRNNTKLREELQKQKRIITKLRMKATRHEQKRRGGELIHQELKPKTFLRNWSTEKGGGTRAKRRRMKNSVKRSVIFQFTLNEEVKAKYKLLCKGKKKSILEIMRGKLMRKYKLLGRASNEFCVSGGRKRKVKGSLSSRLRKQVQTFYER